MDKNDVPRYWQLINPIFDSLKELGGSGTDAEILDKVTELGGYPAEMAEVVHDDIRRQSELSYQIGWAKSYMKIYGIITNGSRGVWTLTRGYINKAECPAGRDIVNEVNRRRRPGNASAAETAQPAQPSDKPELSIADWPDTEMNAFVKKRLAELLTEMSPRGFGQFAQRLLRELGFERVNVTGRSDDGIDGIGTYRAGRVLSVKAAFRCKRCRGTVGAEEVSGFRRALTPDVGHGLMITTGTFSRAAVDEARCPGKQLIDLIDCPTLVDLIFDLGLGVKQNQGWTNMTYMVDERLFAAYCADQ